MPKLQSQIIGAFVLRNEGEGCLTSKYHHGDSLDCPFTESCKLTTALNLNDIFIGTYRTVWLEDTTHIVAELTIRRHPRNNDIFELIWTNNNNPAPLFEGTAMNFDNLLVGTYWD